MAELEGLVISGADMDRELVGEILSPYIRLDKDTCSIRPTEKWEDLDTEQKIVLFLVARKAMMALGFPIQNEQATAAEVIKQTGLPSGSAYPSLRSLLQQRLIGQTGRKGGYSVPNHSLEKVKSMFGKRRKKL